MISGGKPDQVIRLIQVMIIYCEQGEDTYGQQSISGFFKSSREIIEALIQHNEADFSTWIPLEYDLQMTYGTKECSFSEYMKSLRDMVREDSQKKAGMDK